ncbi:major facilitator superfamily MFS-1 [Cutaneotrichosporon oleaginosum]|uniref:Major facilitator superfamily MFS-1 n=1 Tax=Cutaneotrichosporon oleaginosum TaxID=879819 RepID=A0A0J1B4P4_9TREE|nr:major facilitator superfamily MFS-1 [Cutaneotrichosporon oleaginosum]KLT42649.1 major facilitator superfamily MFS-1 [Cutaneotrichosporon oleaginosum]TXT05234.1 hypothetical protein COLE_06554 [Cutaneotrichosporon oleaginosum]
MLTEIRRALSTRNAYDLVEEAEDHAIRRAPTSAESALRRVPASVPLTAHLLALVEFAERASYYGVSGVFANFVQRPLPPGSRTGAPAPGSDTPPGALGMGLRASATVSALFTVMAFASPLFGGALADVRWGKFRTIAVGTAVSGAAHVLCIWAAVPSVLSSGTAFPPFIVSVILLGGATGLIKANIAPLMGQQYVHEDYVATVDGERVIVEREATVQKIMAAYYLSINVGAFLAVGSTFAEKYVGFWLAYLIPGVIFFLMPPLLYFVYPYLAPEPAPSPAALLDAYDILRRAVKGEQSGAEEYELASEDEENGHTVEPKGGDVKQALLACKLFLFFAIYNIADGGLNTIMTSLAGSMTTNGVPNDFLEKANPIAIVLAIPLLNKLVYPFLDGRNIPHGPVRRIVAGFILAAAGMVWCALLQYAVYLTSPCGYSATTCEDGVSPLSAWLLLPTPLLTGASEALACVSALELAFTMSPPGLRSIVTSLFLFTQAISAILILAFLPLMHDPLLVWPFLLAALLTLLAAAGVWHMFKLLDNERP